MVRPVGLLGGPIVVAQNICSRLRKVTGKELKMFQIIQSARVVKCDETGDIGILIAGKIHPVIVSDTQLEMLIAEDMLPAVHENGAILTDENGNVILRY